MARMGWMADIGWGDSLILQSWVRILYGKLLASGGDICYETAAL